MSRESWPPEDISRPRGSSWSSLPPEAWWSSYVFGRCIAPGAPCNGLCSGECTEEDELREAERLRGGSLTP